MSTEKKQSKGAVAFAAGAVAGAAEISVTMPLDTVKTRMQLAGGGTSSIGVARSIVQNDGVSGLYRGMSAMLAQVSLKAAIRFLAYEQIRSSFCMVLDKETQKKNAITLNFFSGVLAGFTEAVVWVTPTERLKVLRQASAGSGGHAGASGSLGGLSALLRQQGVSGLFVGAVPTALRQGTAIGVRFALYGSIKTALAGGEDKKPTALQQLAAGMMTGTISSLINQPIDTAKSRIQAQARNASSSSSSTVQPYKGTLDCIVRVVREEGAFALYRGSVPRVMRLTMGQGIIFCVYDQISAALQKIFAS
uniref:Mitochondrial carrier protein n=1 Tax=Chromera velia CCMP2878 TaxID=1169474 RepID=A0A0G4GDC5_9ALVE|eukprot:Cvel_617.t1-p1 / transcript=Cvel_617.t1 / gene=Cvel_617 / organism=Chromera_velia_CCMP2878 / gene_product=Tricarboxylate transport protein, mitochondrial, putative / transcript_product=Tricarboxylate transport protein, mitochondrial, putative / location=Cvel_scaffold19:32149-33990(+) / protein_length=305 / sequence_SO=supercontig / SO=protein_coding / is_pseudo=false